MAQTRASHIRDALTSLLRPRRIRRLAREVGAVRRRRKVDIVALVYSLALGFASGKVRTLTGLRRAYERATGTSLAPSAFYDRFTVGLTRLLQRLVLEAFDQLGRRTPRLRHVFRRFREVLVTDSTLIRLHNALEAHYPSVFTHYMRASAKLNVVMNVFGRGAKTVRLTHGSRHELRLLECGPWMRNRLLIFDLGYFQGVLFANIGKQGGFFLSRLRNHVDPTLVRSHRKGERRFEGHKLRAVVPQLHSRLVDFDVDMHYRLPRPVWTHCTVRLRVVGLWNDEAGYHHFYITNLPTDRMRAEHIAAVYAARWEVELLFRELKHRYRMGEIPSRSHAVSECLIYAALLTLAISRQLHRALTGNRVDRDRFPFDRWATFLAAAAQDLLDLLVGPRHHRRLLATRITRLAATEALDPNRSRISLLRRAELGAFRFA
jgi:IS4 transposase